jgi:hypothetical protein
MAAKTTPDTEAARMERLLDDLRAVFSGRAGERVLEWMLTECRVNASVFTGNSRTFYLAGRQDFGNRLLALVLAADPGVYARIIEARTRSLNTRETNAKERT